MQKVKVCGIGAIGYPLFGLLDTFNQGEENFSTYGSYTDLVYTTSITYAVEDLFYPLDATSLYNEMPEIDENIGIRVPILSASIKFEAEVEVEVIAVHYDEQCTLCHPESLPNCYALTFKLKLIYLHSHNEMPEIIPLITILTSDKYADLSYAFQNVRVPPKLHNSADKRPYVKSHRLSAGGRPAESPTFLRRRKNGGEEIWNKEPYRSRGSPNFALNFYLTCLRSYVKLSKKLYQNSWKFCAHIQSFSPREWQKCIIFIASSFKGITLRLICIYLLQLHYGLHFTPKRNLTNTSKFPFTIQGNKLKR